MHQPPPSRLLGISDVGIIWLCYALHALALLCGGITSLVALIINYLKRGEARREQPQDHRAALLLSHMQWQINTFWMALGLTVAAALLSVLLAVSVAGVIFLYPLWGLLLVWYVYRLVKGALALNSGRKVE